MLMSGLDKLTNAASKFGSKIATAPSSEAEGIKATTDAVKEYQDAIADKPVTPKATPAAVNPNKVDKSSQYGTRPGEHRYSDAEIKDMTKPLIPVYDNGGDVTVKKTNVAPVKKTAPKSVVRETMNVDTGKPSSSLPPLTPDIKPTSRAFIADLAPVYDKGGNVNVRDGKHQLAILKDGERVLTEKEKNKMDSTYDMVKGMGKDKPPKKEIKEMVHTKSHNGKHIITHRHHSSSHPDEVHALENMADVHSHLEDHAGTPNEGEVAPEAGAQAPAQLTAAPSPMPMPGA